MIVLNETVLKHVKIISTSDVIENGYVVIKNGLITEIGVGSPSIGFGSQIDLDNLIVMPGFIDTHTHGIKGFDVTTCKSPYDILTMSKYYAEHGVTGFLATTVSAPLDTLLNVCKTVEEAMSYWRSEYGARILGIHFEGPYINPEAAGAQNTAYIRFPNLKEFKNLYENCKGVLKQITIAPEVGGANEVIEYAKAVGIVVSAGHTNASYEDGLKAVEMGVTKATHLFNGMKRFHHRDPGISMALLQSPKVYLEVIADFIHLHPAVVKMVIDYASPDRVVLITDSIAATDMPDGVYELGGLKVVVQGGICKLESGSLAGSTLTMEKAVANIAKLGYSLSSIAKMASLTPIKSVNMENLMIGDLKQGYRADLVVLDENYRVVKTMVNGVFVYEK